MSSFCCWVNAGRASAAPSQALPGATIFANAQAQLDQVKTDLNLTQGDVTMLIPDMPNVPPQDTPVLIAQANQAQSGTSSLRTLGVCAPSPNHNYGLENVFGPIDEARTYFQTFEHETLQGAASITVLQQPQHGVLRPVTEADRGTLFDSDSGPLKPGAGLYAYLPDQGYLGKDSATLLVDFGDGKQVKVKYYFQAIAGSPSGDWMRDYCSKTGVFWKVSSTLDANGNSNVTSVEYVPPASVMANASDAGAALSSWINSNDLNSNAANISVNVAPLAGGAVGQDNGNAITLDANAGGYGWYIGTDPASKSDFLPTSDPNVWMAKAGSAAAGKMDMLSVLLHEYGHALGIEHSANPNDFMGATLQVGERRLPSAAELALMRQLIAQAKGGASTVASTDLSGSKRRMGGA